jgi:hypothetical protein
MYNCSSRVAIASLWHLGCYSIRSVGEKYVVGDFESSSHLYRALVYIQQEGSVHHSIRLTNPLRRDTTLFIGHTHYKWLLVGVEEIIKLCVCRIWMGCARPGYPFSLGAALVQLICIYSHIDHTQWSCCIPCISAVSLSLNTVRACHFDLFPPFALTCNSIIDTLDAFHN